MSTPERDWRALSRLLDTVAGAAGIMGALVLGLAVVSWEAHRIALERDIARSSAAREEAIRYYLTNMFRASVAASSRGSEATTAKAMLDLSAQRVLREYRNEPYLAGKVVETLSDLYGGSCREGGGNSEMA